ncbi:MAG: SDR family NAD(P)-dependent oxidoreductase [Actinomycetota bacterium]|nr:SDR family NAD(P)-dependent oxidoreductase [Actinomycetota bacterium]
MRDIDEAVVLVTGATDGLGRRVARDLAARGATVLVHGRDAGRAETAMREIREGTGNDDLRSHLADLSSLDEVRGLAEEVLSEHSRLDVLVNNAGIGPGERSKRAVSRDGHELRFAVNYLAHFLLTRMLLPLLRRSAPARIVNVSSGAQTRIDFDDVMLERRYEGMRAYGQSKLAQVMDTFDLAEELAGTGVTVNCLHPASLMNTKMVSVPMRGVQAGADATVRLVADPALAEVTGRYFSGKTEARADAQAYDRGARAALRRLSEALTGLGDGRDPAP